MPADIYQMSAGIYQMSPDIYQMTPFNLAQPIKDEYPASIAKDEVTAWVQQPVGPSLINVSGWTSIKSFL